LINSKNAKRRFFFRDVTYQNRTSFSHIGSLYDT